MPGSGVVLHVPVLNRASCPGLELRFMPRSGTREQNSCVLGLGEGLPTLLQPGVSEDTKTTFGKRLSF